MFDIFSTQIYINGVYERLAHIKIDKKINWEILVYDIKGDISPYRLEGKLMQINNCRADYITFKVRLDETYCITLDYFIKVGNDYQKMSYYSFFTYKEESDDEDDIEKNIPQTNIKKEEEEEEENNDEEEIEEYQIDKI